MILRGSGRVSSAAKIVNFMKILLNLEFWRFSGKKCPCNALKELFGKLYAY